MLNQRLQRVPILVFHRIDEQFDKYTQPMHPTEFKKLILLLAKQFNFYSLDDLRKVDDPKACFITFDDATKDFYSYAWPILKSHSIPATLFIPTDSVEKKQRIWNNELFYLLNNVNNPVTLSLKAGKKFTFTSKSALSEILKLIDYLKQDKEEIESVITSLKTEIKADLSANELSRPMTWSELSSCVNEGLTVGSHGASHLDYSFLTVEEARYDANHSKSLIFKNLEIETKHFAFPMGMYSAENVEIISGIYENIFTTESKLYTSQDILAPRVSMYDNLANEALSRALGFHRMVRNGS
jgi:peptidoglycan/xylan/chitin deacetylase (PgdA/CDA1 family)